MQSFFAVEDEREGEAAGLDSVGMSEELAGESMAAISDLITRLDSGSSDLVDLDFYVPSGSEPCCGPKPHLETSAPMNPMTEQPSRSAQPPDSTGVEVVEQPSRRSQTVRSRTDSTETTGQSAEAFAVADYLQLAAMARRSVELIVQGPEGAQGRILVADGLVMTAQDGHGSGADAFGRLAMMDNVAVECRPLQETPVGNEVLGAQVDELLLDAARRRDEQQQGRSTPPTAVTSDKAPGKGMPHHGGEEGSGARLRSDVVPAGVANPTDAGSVEVLVAPRAGGGENASRFAGGRVEGRPPRLPPPTQPARRIAPSSARKEMPVSATTVPGAKPKADSILTSAPALSAVARAAADGSVMEVAGEMDAETACAVAALAGRQLEEVAAELGLGDVQSWHMGLGDSTWYVISEPAELLVVRGDLAKNPAAVLQKIENGWRR